MRPQDQKFYRMLIDRFCLPRPILAASVCVGIIADQMKMAGKIKLGRSNKSYNHE